MTSVERIVEYSNLDGEDVKTGRIMPSSDWPQHGKIIFDDVSFSYDKHLPNVLSNITFCINPKEKIGIVGRTGAGKSTVFQTLFRMAEPTGTIYIDDIDINGISLYQLRSKIAIIPVSLVYFMQSCRILKKKK
jgi:ATP-binding cassette subfamily C (CFTR/MRP) protein 4